MCGYVNRVFGLGIGKVREVPGIIGTMGWGWGRCIHIGVLAFGNSFAWYGFAMVFWDHWCA
jgi:hypothetical protein